MEKHEISQFWYKIKPRVIASPSVSSAIDEIRNIPTSPEVVEHMARKSFGYAVLIHNISGPQAHILKETMLSLDGDAAVHRMLIKERIDATKVVVLGTKRQLDALGKKMHGQPFAMNLIAECIRIAISNFNKDSYEIKMGNNKKILAHKPLIMGVLNVTEDSFSDGGKFINPDNAYAHAVRMIEEGADMIDIGGESSRPGAQPISAETEIRNVLPVIEKIRANSDIPISIDTLKPAVAQKAIEAGADIINDITGARNHELVMVAAAKKAGYIAMHMQGNPQTMQKNPEYENVVSEIFDNLSEASKTLEDAGVEPEGIILDVGFGFGKTVEHNLALLKYHSQFKSLGKPMLAGISRKSMFQSVTGANVDDRVIETISAHYHCLSQGARILRVHDVKEAQKSIKVFHAIENA